MVGAMDTPPRSIPATPGPGQPLVGFAVPGACPWWYLGILLGELSNLLLSLGHVISQQKGARRAPVLQQWGEGVGVTWEYPQTVPLQDRDAPPCRDSLAAGCPCLHAESCQQPRKGWVPVPAAQDQHRFVVAVG